MNDSPGATERWKGQAEGLKLYSSYPDAVGIDGEAIELESTNFPGFSSSSILQEIQKRLGEEEHPARRVQGPNHLWCHCLEKE